MKVILKEDVEKLGRRGDVVNVAPGFGRNYLIPRKMAIAVTPTNNKMIEIERAALKMKSEAERKSFQSLAEKLGQVTLTFARRAGDKDVIFGSDSAGDVKEALDALGYDVDKKKILLDEPIKRHDGEEVFAVLSGRVEMRYRKAGVEHSTILETGDVFHAAVGTEHVAHPIGEARILVVEHEGTV